RCERQQSHLAGAPGGVAVLAAPETDDGAPGRRFTSGDLLHERGQRLGIPTPDRRSAAGDESRDVLAGRLHFVVFTSSSSLRRLHWAAFAAAFLAFLCSRTFASGSGETMSATLR